MHEDGDDGHHDGRADDQFQRQVVVNILFPLVVTVEEDRADDAQYRQRYPAVNLEEPQGGVEIVAESVGDAGDEGDKSRRNRRRAPADRCNAGRQRSSVNHGKPSLDG